MKKTTTIIILSVTTLTLVKCGPAAEDRFKMHENANRISDSITKAIDTELAKGAIPNSVPTTDTTKKGL